MIRFSKILICATVLLLVAWQLPWCVSFLAPSVSKSSFVLYSTVIDDFVFIGVDDDNNPVRTSRNGTVFTQQDVDSILPFFYVRQLTSDQRFPDSIKGVEVSPRLVQQTNFSFRKRPSEINAPQIGLYFLLESMSGRVDLSMPGDVFRINDKGIEFVDMKTNTVDIVKSNKFTKAMRDKGFSFPALWLNGNATTHKEYDEGYLVIDNERQLFHIKQVCGRPYVKRINHDGVSPRYAFITEFRDRSLLGFVVDQTNSLYVLRSDGSLIKTGVESYNPETDAISIFGNLLDATVAVKNNSGTVYYALSTDDYQLIDRLDIPFDGVATWGVHFTSPNDKFVKFRVN